MCESGKSQLLTIWTPTDTIKVLITIIYRFYAGRDLGAFAVQKFDNTILPGYC
jgi:hypothetical protein